ncbi:MAG: DNA polymerase IV [Candidatus Omnitrophota bacterium]
MDKKVIVHVDMDAFFASVEQRDHPELKGRPVVVGADPKNGQGRGVVATCSYEARRYGLHSALPISIAYRLCPQAVFLPCDYQKYERVSFEIQKIFYDFTPDVEQVSIDEAFLDISGSYHFYQTPYATGLALKERIRKNVRLTASVGIAPVKMAAKIASDLCKPDGLLEVREEKLLEFLHPLGIERLWGVGPQTKKLLNARDIHTVGQLAAIPLLSLAQEFGEHGRHLYDLAHGIDPRAVEPLGEAKSVSHEHTFEQDTQDQEKIYRALLALSEKVSRRLRKSELKGKTLTVKIRTQGFRTHTRAHTFPERTNLVDDIYKKAKEIFGGFYKRGDAIRLVGVKVSNFEDPYVGESLFSDTASRKAEGVHKAIDLIKDKFGEDAIHRGL